jgi:hypothetical protein
LEDVEEAHRLLSGKKKSLPADEAVPGSTVLLSALKMSKVVRSRFVDPESV